MSEAPTLDQVREVIRQELTALIEHLMHPQAGTGAKRPRRRQVIAGREEQVTCTNADIRFGWRNGTARELYQAGKLKGQGDPSAPHSRCKVTLASCRAWVTGGGQ